MAVDGRLRTARDSGGDIDQALEAAAKAKDPISGLTRFMMEMLGDEHQSTIEDLVSKLVEFCNKPDKEGRDEGLANRSGETAGERLMRGMGANDSRRHWMAADSRVKAEAENGLRRMFPQTARIRQS
jgi:hypothetical protein